MAPAPWTAQAAGGWPGPCSPRPASPRRTRPCGSPPKSPPSRGSCWLRLWRGSPSGTPQERRWMRPKRDCRPVRPKPACSRGWKASAGRRCRRTRPQIGFGPTRRSRPASRKGGRTWRPTGSAPSTCAGSRRFGRCSDTPPPTPPRTGMAFETRRRAYSCSA